MTNDIYESCPFCGNSNLNEEYTPVYEGSRDSQSGWIECLDCGACGPVICADDEQIKSLSKMTIAAWNSRLNK